VHLVDNSAEFVGDKSHRTMTEYESWTAAHSSEAVRLGFARIAASDPMFPLKLTPEIVTVAIRHSRGPGTVSAEIEGVQRFKTAQITWETCKRHEVSNLHQWRWSGVKLEEILSYTRSRIQNFGYLHRSHANHADIDCGVLRHDLLERVEMTIPDSKEARWVGLAHGAVVVEHMSASDYQEFAIAPQKCGGAVVHLRRVLAGRRHAEEDWLAKAKRELLHDFAKATGNKSFGLIESQWWFRRGCHDFQIYQFSKQLLGILPPAPAHLRELCDRDPSRSGPQ
jgi:hypothetical protein